MREIRHTFNVHRVTQRSARNQFTLSLEVELKLCSADGAVRERWRPARPRLCADGLESECCHMVDDTEIGARLLHQLLLLDLVAARRLLVGYILDGDALARRRLGWRLDEDDGAAVVARAAEHHTIRLDPAEL